MKSCALQLVGYLSTGGRDYQLTLTFKRYRGLSRRGAKVPGGSQSESPGIPQTVGDQASSDSPYRESCHGPVSSEDSDKLVGIHAPREPEKAQAIPANR